MRRPRRRRELLPPPADRTRALLGAAAALFVPVALLSGRLAFAVVLALLAGGAAFEVGRAWVAHGVPVEPVVMALVAAALPLAAAADTGATGAVVLAAAAVSVVGPLLVRREAVTALDAAGRAIGGWLGCGFAGAGLVFAHRWEIGSAVALLLMVAVHDLGLTLVGHGGSKAEAVIAAVTGIVVVAFVIAMIPVPPFEPGSMLAFGALATAAIPLGPVLGSLLLPGFGARAPVLRRLDSLLVVSPLWAWTVGLHVA